MESHERKQSGVVFIFFWKKKSRNPEHWTPAKHGKARRNGNISIVSSGLQRAVNRELKFTLQKRSFLIK
jgi:hypothetical protein|nr:MAG TPA: hypothetical protein [Caudoviricetes sp.]